MESVDLVLLFDDLSCILYRVLSYLPMEISYPWVMVSLANYMCPYQMDNMNVLETRWKYNVIYAPCL